MILSMLVLLIFTGCVRFNGSRTSNDAQFIMKYSILNDTKTHEMKLKEGTIIDVVIENKSGRLDVLITDENGEKIYKGDDTLSGKFSIRILKTGTYKFVVTGKKAKGGVSFKVAH